DYWAPPGASLAETDRMLRDVEDKLMKTPEIESYSRRTGLEMGLFVTEPNRGDYAVKLKPGHKRETDEVISDLRKQIEEAEPALEIEFVGIVPDVIGDLQGNPEPIEIKLYSEDAAALQSKADEVAKAAAAAMTGDEASFILQQDRLIRVRVLFPADVRSSLDKVKALQVR